jgi:hypothetical protein
MATQIHDHRNGHFVRPNKVAFKYHAFKTNVNIDVHVKMYNFTINANAKTFEEYIINAFSHTLRDTTSDMPQVHVRIP